MDNNILLVEDDENLGYILKEYLEMNEFQVAWARDGKEGLSKFKKDSFDLCILDIMMPKKDGFTLAEEINKENKQVPFVFLTAKTLKVDQLKGFDIGADDYIVKPVDEELLIARIRAILNRSNGDMEKDKLESYDIGRYDFDPNTRELKLDGEKIDSLTPREADLLGLLCENVGSILTRDEALETIWGDSNYFNRRIMDVYISKLRKYFNDDPDIEIKNVHSKGFVLSI